MFFSSGDVRFIECAAFDVIIIIARAPEVVAQLRFTIRILMQRIGTTEHNHYFFGFAFYECEWSEVNDGLEESKSRSII